MTLSALFRYLLDQSLLIESHAFPVNLLLPEPSYVVKKQSPPPTLILGPPISRVRSTTTTPAFSDCRCGRGFFTPLCGGEHPALAGLTTAKHQLPSTYFIDNFFMSDSSFSPMASNNNNDGGDDNDGRA